MRLRDNPIVEVSRKLSCSPERAWELVTDIALPTRAEGELQRVEWLDGADRVAVGARFRGYNRNNELGDWATDSVITEVEDGRRWVWSVGATGSPGWATWGFEIDPARDGSLVRQWARIGNAESPFATFVASQPEKEGRIIEYRLRIWQSGMEANLECLARESIA